MASPSDIGPAVSSDSGDGAEVSTAPLLAPSPLTDAERQVRLESAIWHGASLLFRRKWWIMVFCFLIAVAAAAISLQIPNRYAASARLLIPDSSGGGLGALIGDLSPLARGVLGGGGGGDYSRYIAILTSRTVMEDMVDQFDLVQVYDLGEKEHPKQDAVSQLASNVDFTVDIELEFLEISVIDEDPQRAAAMANALTAQLNERNAALATQSARAFREYVETRYQEAEDALDSARVALQQFQERNGVVELETMAQAYVEALATQRAEQATLEIQYEALRSQYGDENPDVAAAAAALQTARRNEETLLQGGDRAVPLSYRSLPSLGSRYAALYQEILIQAQVLEASRPLLEQARFDEARERVAVQVVDEAVPPVRKAEPRRTIIVLVSAFSAFLLVCAFLLALDWFNRNGEALFARLRRTAA